MDRPTQHSAEQAHGTKATGRPGGAVAETAAVVKPRLRGWLHAGAAPLVLAAGIVLICLSDPGAPRWAAVAYTVSGLALFTTSAVYNIGTFSPPVQRLLRRLDHSNIYLIIAGSYTPITYYGLSGWRQDLILVLVWSGAALGVFFRVIWTDAPRALYTALYVVLGWCVVPFVGDLLDASVAAGVLTIVGGGLYTVGGIVYAAKRPDPYPTWFGFHEVFHTFTIAAWTCQFVAICLLAF